MPLARLENFLKNLNGNILYVDPNELDSTDSIENRGNSRLRPFKTIQRALIEAARFAYVPGTNNDLFDQTTILISPGTHFVDNRPGYYIDESNTIKDVNGSTRTISEFNVSSNFDLTDPSNQLYIFNSHTGGVIVPKGTSLVAQDLRKTKIRPKYVPNPTDDNIDRSSIFQLTGACYIFGFTIFDGDPIGKVYNNYSTNTTVPNFSHHKLTAFEYADDTNTIVKGGVDTTHTDLENYYYKLSLAFGSQSSRNVIDGFDNFQPNVDENRIVGELGTGNIIITSVVSGNGISGTSVITVQTQSPHGLSPFTPIIISGVGQVEGPTTELEYNGNFVVAQVVSETEFTYLLSNVPTQSLVPSVVGATVKVISDTVSSASPYVFNCSLKSVYGMNGLHADGSRAKGFKSMVTAQFTGISLQKDDRSFVEYDEVSGAYKFQDNFGVDKFLHQSSRAKYRPEWETFHIKASNDAFIQCVSIFAIGYATQFVTASGGDQSITNSNSNFGQIALYSTGYKSDVLPKDNHAFITHIIPPKDIAQRESVIRYNKINSNLTTGLSTVFNYSRVYFDGFNDLLNPPENTTRGFTIGGKENDILFYRAAQEQYEIPITPNYKLEYDITSIDTTTNIITLSGISGIQTGLSGKIVSGNGALPDGIVNNKIYNVRLTGGNGIKLYDNLTNAENDVSTVDIKNQLGISTGNLKFVSKINEKSVGDVGHPIQWDAENQNWYVGVNSVGLGATAFFTNLLITTAPVGFVRRQLDTRRNQDKAYRVRVVVPKESESSSDISSGFIFQRASNALSSLLYQSGSTDLVSSTGNELSLIRNKNAIIDAWYDAGTATIVTSKPHNLSVGDVIKIYNLKSSAEPAPVGLGTGTGFNGQFTVNSVVNELRFTYAISRDPGEISVGISTAESWLTIRDCNQTSNYRIPPYTIYDSSRSDLPYFIQKDLQNDYQSYEIETISNYQQGITDGIYHVVINAFKNSPNISPFNTDQYKFSQTIERLYPETDPDNPDSDPNASSTIASRSEIGTIQINDVTKSSTKESLVSFLKDLNVGKSIVGLTTYYDGGLNAGIATVTTSTNHGLGGIKRLTISSGGSGFLNGTYYDIPLCGGSGADATVNVTVSGNSVTAVSIQNFGSGYVVGNSLTIRGIPGSSNTASVVVADLNQETTDADTIQIHGCRNDSNNGTFIIKGLTSNTITYYNNDAVPETPEQGIVFLGGPGYQLEVVPDGAVYSSLTDSTTIITQEAHNFAVGNKVIFDDQIGYPANIGISTISNVLGITSFTVRGDASAANRVFSYGLSSIARDTDAENENLASRHFAIYDGFKSRTNQSVSLSDINFLVTDLNGLQKGDIIQVNSEIMLVTKVSGGEIYVKRGQFGTKITTHQNLSAIKRITVIPIEFRRNSIIRASGHTFEYVGFGPGNYSTGMPSNQDRILTDSEVLISQSLSSNGGLVVYTGMNSDGEFFIGKTKFDAVTGKQTDLNAVVEDDADRLSLDALDVNSLIVNASIDASTATAVFQSISVETDSEIAGVTTFTSVQTSTSPQTGALVVSGGVGIGDNLNVENSATIGDVIIAPAGTAALNSTTGQLTIQSNLSVTGVSTLSTLSVTGGSTLTGNVSAGASITSVGDIVAGPSAKFKGYGTIPIGGIIMWSGSVASIPSGWALCNGSNGTPNLQNRFIVGAGSGYSVGDTGGADSVILTTDQIPAHNHGGSTNADGIHSHGIQDPGHNHSEKSGIASRPTSSGGGRDGCDEVDRTTGTSTTGISINNSPSHTHGINSQGGGQSHENRPPYYALAFIMRTV
jgi:microcystin-dependent protein